MASSVQELWDVLNAGKQITDGKMVVWYENGYIDSIPECNNPMLWAANENYTHWDEKIEEIEEIEETDLVDPDESRYCRWYVERADGSFEINMTVWHPIEKEPYEHNYRMDESYTKAEIVGTM